MGIAIRIADATFTKHIGIAEIEDDPIIPDVPDEPTVHDTYPVTDTLKGLYYLGGTEAESLVNHAEGGSNATVPSNSTFAVSDAYATFTGNEGSSRIATGITTAPTNKTTIIGLFRVPTGVRVIASNRAYQTSHITLTNWQASYRVGGTGSYTRFKDNQIINSDANFALLAMTANTDGCRVVRHSDGELVELANYSGGIDEWTTQQFFIGGAAANASENATADIALVSIHEGEMTDEQLQQIFAHVRWYGESKGLTIE